MLTLGCLRRHGAQGGRDAKEQFHVAPGADVGKKAREGRGWQKPQDGEPHGAAVEGSYVDFGGSDKHNAGQGCARGAHNRGYTPVIAELLSSQSLIF